TRVGVRRDQDVARIEISLRPSEDDSGPSLYGPGGNRQANQRTGWKVVASIRALDCLAIRRQHARWRERPIRREGFLAFPNELMVHLVRAHGLPKLFEPEV